MFCANARLSSSATSYSGRQVPEVEMASRAQKVRRQYVLARQLRFLGSLGPLAIFSLPFTCVVTYPLESPNVEGG